MSTVLLTGFEPFGGAETNSSWDALALVHTDAQLVTACLPVAFGRAADIVHDLIVEHSPDVVIAVGMAEGRMSVTPERVALNVEDARIPDNVGDRPIDRAVVEDGPAAYFTGLPVKAMVQRMRAAGVPAELSQTAGTFVCNSLMYELLHDVATRHPSIRAGFVHVPSGRDMDLATIARGLEIAVSVALERGADVRVSEGAES